MDEMNRKIAEALGWRVFQEGGEDAFGLIDAAGKFILDGSVMRPFSWSAEQAWQHAPDYTHDLNAVVAALPDGASLTLYSSGGYMAVIEIDRRNAMYPDDVIRDDYSFTGATRQEAAARALLALLQATAASESP